MKNSFIATHVLILILLISGARALAAAQADLPPVKPLKTDQPPVIDGRLDDPVWEHAPRVAGFKTWHPDYGKVMEDDTVVYFAYDRENLFFAFRCFDSRPERIKSSVTSRDNIRNDDWIGINLDTFNDQQSLHVFYCNPLGIQGDSRFEGGKEDHTVDLVWFSRGRIDEQGYVVEVRIPFKSIRYSGKTHVEMGVIFERQINRLSEIGTNPPLDPRQGPNFLTQTMALVFEDVERYRLVEVLPAVTAGRNSETDQGALRSAGGESELSLTAKYGITPELILDGTVNPDFSQVEADAGQVDFNLRYALYFPETRPFFLEGLEKFNFGGTGSGDPLGNIVHTRTIVNPRIGFKLNGKISRRDTIAAIYALDELPRESAEDSAHFTIFRYKRALAGDSFLGGFYTGRERSRGSNRVYGADGQLRLSPSSIFGFHLFNADTRREEWSEGESGHALGLHYMYDTRDWVVMAGLQDVSAGFRTEAGYVTRTGITRLRTGVLRQLYPKSSFIQRIDPMVHSFHVYDHESKLYETMNALDVRFYARRSTMFQVGGRYATESFLGRRFQTSHFLTRGTSQLTRSLTASFSYTLGKKIRYLSAPYSGSGSDASASITWLPSDRLHLGISLIYSDFTRDADHVQEYEYTILRSRNVFQFSKHLFFRGILEYNSFHKTLMTDLLASFTYIPGTVVHLGYGSLFEKLRWAEGAYRPADSFLETRRGLFFKASYLWRW